MKGHGGYFRNDDPPQAVGQTCIDPWQLHLDEIFTILYDIDVEIFFYSAQVENLLLRFVLDYLFLLKFKYIFSRHQQLFIIQEIKIWNYTDNILGSPEIFGELSEEAFCEVALVAIVGI